MNTRAGADRRSGTDRRVEYDLFYFSGGVERRRQLERRKVNELRAGWARISQWSSAKADELLDPGSGGATIHTLRKRIPG